MSEGEGPISFGFLVNVYCSSRALESLALVISTVLSLLWRRANNGFRFISLFSFRSCSRAGLCSAWHHSDLLLTRANR
jgi:hypothetical protein